MKGRAGKTPDAGASQTPLKQGPAKKLDEGLLSRASQEILAYTRENQPLLDRAERYGSRSRRLLEDGTESETAANKAERAWDELMAGLAALRVSFMDRNGEDRERAGAAFDHESRNIFPGQSA